MTSGPPASLPAALFCRSLEEIRMQGIRFNQIHTARRKKIIQLFVSSVEDMDRYFRINPGKFRHCLMKLLTAVASQIPDAKFLNLILADPDRLFAGFLNLINNPIIWKILFVFRMFQNPERGYDSDDIQDIYQNRRVVSQETYDRHDRGQ